MEIKYTQSAFKELTFKMGRMRMVGKLWGLQSGMCGKELVQRNLISEMEEMNDR